MKPTLFSIIIPVYNGAKHLPGVICSINDQIFCNAEILFIDANSTDDSLEIIKKCTANSKIPVRIFSTVKSGVYTDMNKGIEWATGEWLLFLGCDDKIKDEFVLQDVANALHQFNEPDVLYGNVRLLSNNETYGGIATVHTLLHSQNICHQAIFYHYSIFNKIGNFNTDYPIWADWELNIRLFRHTHLRKQYFNREIVLYNDTEGVSSQEDELLKQELPVFLHRQHHRDIFQLQNSQAFRWGLKLVGYKEAIKKWGACFRK